MPRALAPEPTGLGDEGISILERKSAPRAELTDPVQDMKTRHKINNLNLRCMMTDLSI